MLFIITKNKFTSTNNTQLNLSQDRQLSLIQNDTKEKENDSFHIQPMAIPIKPKSRYNKPKKHLKSKKEQAISGHKNCQRFSFCGLHSNIQTKKRSSFGNKNVDEPQQEHSPYLH